ncbi:MAG: DMT family transporter [Proteobacteria bacterium]|nr:DMT family transporter [Pseudomonadota bacterium]MBI3495751.1 DMT family transporter [Pseudomonadota bacterium]
MRRKPSEPRSPLPALLLPTPTREDIKRGIAYMSASVLLFALLNVLVKWLMETYAAPQVLLFRSLFAVIPCAWLIWRSGGIAVLRTRHPFWHVSRAGVQFISMVAIFTAYGMMPLADAVAITYASPLFLTALSVPVLGEKVGVHRWGAVMLGFIGVLIMVRPGAGGSLIQLGALLALTNALIGACLSLSVRAMTVSETAVAMVSYQALFTFLLALPMQPFVWVQPTPFDFLLLASLGLGSAVGQYWWTQAFRLAPASVNAPFSYTALVWAIGFGWLIWGDVPSQGLMLGAGIVVVSGLYILYRETVRRVPRSALAAKRPVI